MSWWCRKKTKHNKAALFRLSRFSRLYRKIKTNLIIITNRFTRMKINVCSQLPSLRKHLTHKLLHKYQLYWTLQLKTRQRSQSCGSNNLATGSLLLLCDRVEEVYKSLQRWNVDLLLPDSDKISSSASSIMDGILVLTDLQLTQKRSVLLFANLIKSTTDSMSKFGKTKTTDADITCKLILVTLYSCFYPCWNTKIPWISFHL